MEYEQVGSSGKTEYVKPKDLKAGDTIEGIYRGSFVDKYEKDNFRVEQADGITKVINGTGLLSKLFAEVSEGTPVKVVYDGTNVLKTGQYKGTKAHSFKLLIAKGATKAAAKVEANALPL